MSGTPRQRVLARDRLAAERRQPQARREVISVDFDGVLHEHPGWTPRDGAIAVELIRALQKAGYAVAVSTCNEIPRVGRSLRKAGLAVHEDRDHALCSWGFGGDEVLVTGRKVCAQAYIDDRAVFWTFGSDLAVALAGVEFVEAVRKGGKPVPAYAR